jgi:hypothetical protein
MAHDLERHRVVLSKRRLLLRLAARAAALVAPVDPA